MCDRTGAKIVMSVCTPLFMLFQQSYLSAAIQLATWYHDDDDDVQG